MPQAPQPGVLDRIFQKFQGRKQQVKPPADETDPTKQKQTPEETTSHSDDPTSMFAGLFAPDDPSKVKQAPKFTVAREKITEAAGKMDFMKGLPKELVDSMQQDGGMTFENIANLVNHVGRNAYSSALEHGTALTGHYVESRVGYENEQLPDRMRTHMGKQRAMPKGMDNPVIKEHLSFISERIAAKFPDATEDDIAEMSQEYFVEMAKGINPGAFQNTTQQEGRSAPSAEIQDYDSYLQGTKTLDQAKTAPAPGAKAA